MGKTAMALVCGPVLAGCGRGAGDAADTSAAGDTTTAGATAGATPGAGATDSARAAGEVAATVIDTSGRELGVLTLVDAEQGIAVSGSLRGLAPGRHGMHVHMTGRCDPPEFASAGTHWNPTTRQHGAQNAQGAHLGDMPNLEVGADSSAGVQATTAGGSLRGANALLDEDGAAIVIHAGADDARSDPAGESGSPIACGVVRAR